MASENDVTEILPLIRVIRGKRVILDSDLANLYGVQTKRLNEQVRRNSDRFPSDFLIRLESADLSNLRSQFATSSGAHGGRRYLPYGFTEHGALMAANVLNSKRAVAVSVSVVRAFVRLRREALSRERLARNLAELAAEVKDRLDGHDQKIDTLFEALRQMLEDNKEPPRPRIGFKP